jgi:multiple sugar transport system substrate-binding protein
MKTLAALIAALVCLAGALSAGALRVAHAAPDTRLDLFIGKITTPPGAQDKLMKQLIARFEKQNPGISASYTTYNAASQETTTLETSLATHQGPNLFEFGSTIVPVAASTGGFPALSAKDWNAVGGRSRYFPNQLTMAGPSPDKYMSVPEYMLPFALVYNKAMFKAAGITRPPTTWTEFVTDAKRLTIPAKKQWGVAMDPSDSFDPWHIVWVLTRRLGGRFVSPDLKKAELNSPIVYKAMSFWLDWLTTFKIADPTDVTYKAEDMLAAFEQRHAAMLVMQGPTLIPSLNKSVVKNEYAFAPMPTIPYGMTKLPTGGVAVQTFISGQYYAVPQYTPDRQAALKWINFVTDVPQQRLFFKYYGYLPVNVKAYEGYAPLDTPLIRTFVAAEGHAYPTPFTGAWGQVEVAVGAASAKMADEIGTHTYHSGDLRAELDSVNAAVQRALQQH